MLANKKRYSVTAILLVGVPLTILGGMLALALVAMILGVIGVLIWRFSGVNSLEIIRHYPLPFGFAAVLIFLFGAWAIVHQNQDSLRDLLKR